MAMFVGIVVVNLARRSSPVVAAQAAPAKVALRVGVVLLGLRLPVADIVDLGPPGVLIVITTVAVTYWATCRIGDALRLERGLVTLIASGFAVCGAAAVAAVEGGVRRRDSDVGLAVAMVTVFGTVMLVLEPVVARLLGMSDLQLGVWAGASIHEVAQVIASASAAGAVAVAAAVTIKLGRVACLAVVYLAARSRDAREVVDGEAPPLVPWFVCGFLLAVGVRATGVLPDAALTAGDRLTTVLLGAGMYGLGLGIHRATMARIPPAVLVLSASSTLVAATTSGLLVAVLIGG